MSIISVIGRRSLKVRLLIGSIYTILLLGAVSMVYPFMLMIAGSTKSAVDAPDAKLIPPFLSSDTALYQKHVEGFFNESLEALQMAHNVVDTSFRAVAPLSAPNHALANAWRAFIAFTDLPPYTYGCAYVQAPVTRGVFPSALRAFKEELSAEYDGDIARLNRGLATEFVDWNAFYLLPENYLPRRSTLVSSLMDDRFALFKAALPLESRIYFSPENYYRHAYLRTQYQGAIERYNQTHGTSHASWDDVHLDRNLPVGPDRSDLERGDWITFARSVLNLLWLRAEPAATPFYRDFLKAKYLTVAGLNRNYGTAYTSFNDIVLEEEPPQTGLMSSDWSAFVEGWKDPAAGTIHMLPADMIRIDSIDFMFRDYLKSTHGTLTAANAALGTAYRDWLEILPPQRDLFAIDFAGRKAELRKEFLLRNYLCVLDYIVLHGRGISNTAIYCALAILCALTVNPLAAYALSRYKPPSAYKILLFLMMTMAFPPMVTQIPSFLLLRELGLLNTFAALVLPAMANGYSIFLLKGFFDSLPQELYESAEIDGAGEFRIFWQITMSLSTPILAVVGLSAFTAAYSNFMMALLICQDDKMWTIMPWLYQLQQRSGQGVIFASLLVASVPTFLVFVFCQNIIMRGIVVPVEK
ncbi:MAG: ABC transporter permease subunit [Lentisphaerae bacterium]|nr:ABC transporter permease subunit [Lentisphaerota bacterium]